ncbi:MAG: hypothetical protein Q9176_007445 [Flavoplaca citrina]
MDPFSPTRDQDSSSPTVQPRGPKRPTIPRWYLLGRRKQHRDEITPPKTPRIRRGSLLSILTRTFTSDHNTTLTHCSDTKHIGTASNPWGRPSQFPERFEDAPPEESDGKAPTPSKPPSPPKPMDRSSFSDYPRLRKNDLKPLPPLPDLHPWLSGTDKEEPVPLVILSVRRRLGSGRSQKSRELKERLRSRFSR